MTLWAHVYKAWISGTLRVRNVDVDVLAGGPPAVWLDVVEAMFVEWCRPGDRSTAEVHRHLFTGEFDEPPFFDPEIALRSARQVAAFAALDAAGQAR